jgi:hypothetical protein
LGHVEHFYSPGGNPGVPVDFRQGRSQGQAEGKAEDLKRLLARRFGPLPKWATARIDGATVDQMDAWLDGIFDAPTLDALLGPPPRPTRRRKPAG